MVTTSQMALELCGKKTVDGKLIASQRFISIMCPVNEILQLLPGSQDRLPYISQLAGVLCGPDEYLVVDSEDLESAFNLFRVPPGWVPFFAYSKKVQGDALGGSKAEWVRPGLCVLPMGWSSAVTLAQAAIRHLTYTIAGISSSGDVAKDRPLPAENDLTVLYLDNFDEIRILRKDLADAENDASPNHLKFIKACDSLGLPRFSSKQVMGSFSACLQGGEVDGWNGVLKHGSDKTKKFMGLGLALLAQDSWGEFSLRHWAGKAGFICGFRRPLYALLQEVFRAIATAESSTKVAPYSGAVDEVMSMVALCAFGETNLRAAISQKISCTDASPTGGGSGISAVFKSKGMIPPDLCRKSLPVELAGVHRSEMCQSQTCHVP